MMRQYLQKAACFPASLPKSITGTGATTPITIDTFGYDSMILHVATDAPSGGAQAGAKLTLTVVEGDTTSPVTSVTFDTTPAVIDVSGAGATNSTYFFNLRGLKRYLKFTLTGVAANSGNNVTAASCILGDSISWTVGETAGTRANGTTAETAATVATVYAKV